MANKLYEESSVQAIAEAIRSKNGSSSTYKIGEMAAAILAIPAGTGTNYLPTVCNNSSYSLGAGALTGVTSIKDYTFYNAAISTIVFPSGLTTIGESAFQNADLSGGNVDLPASVTSIGPNAFKDTTGKTFICRATTPPTISTNSFGSSQSMDLAIYVPDDSLSAYRASWTSYGQRIHALSDLPA